ncbi:SOS response-associated peptidase [Robertkochia aurantiaca]|uniref:SOS response-associated peptidase n=1 Tax=Robertkochia aurantiaca TaxID=2873700 RepID=UPI001CCACB13|nr:SOS response-associated peptidase [Robertkochia sp. 3YJGBD-33]
MCYHTSQTKTTSQLEKRFNVSRDKRYDIGELDFTFYHSNGFAHQNILIVPQQEPDTLTPAKWGLIPPDQPGADHESYYKKSIRYGSGLNARSEKLFDHFVYRLSAYERRCLVPLDGFFEPHEKAGKKFPYYIHRKNKECFGVAGIYTITPDNYVTVSLLTKEASPFMAEIHNKRKRQPVLLKAEDENAWLDPAANREQLEAIIASAYKDESLEGWAVSRDLFRTGVDSDRPSIVEPFPYSELNALF